MNQADFAASLLAADAPCPPGLRAWNGSDPAQRWAVHRNNVIASLVDALADTFPVTGALVGAEFFRAMAALFVRQHPPRSRLLVHYGAAFPAFIEAFAPARGLPYLADVARLERSRVQAYHAVDAPALAASAVQVALAGAADAAELQLVCQPSLGVLVSRFAVVSLWAAHQSDDDRAIASVDPFQAESALVLRVGLEVLVLPLAAGHASFFTALHQGAGLGDAAAAAQADAAVQAADFDLAEALSLAVRHDLFTSLRLPHEDTP